MHLLVLCFSAFATVFLLVFQQQNVIHRKYLWAAITSVGITLSQVMVIKGVAQSGSWVEVAALAVGGVAGVLSSMFIHGRLVEWYGRQQACAEES